MGPRENNHVIQVNQARLPLDSRKDHINGPLERSGRVSETKGEPDVLIGPFVTGECRLVLVLEGHRDLPITSVGIQHRENGRLPGSQYNRPSGEGVSVLDREVVEPTVINTESGVPSDLGTKTTGKDHSACDGSMTWSFSCFSTCSLMRSRWWSPVRYGWDLMGRALLQRDAMRGDVQPAQLAIPESLVSVQQFSYRAV